MSSHEIWQVEVDSRIYDATIEEVIEWIQEGAILPDDKVRRGSLRWLPAQRVPELYRHFNQTTTVAELLVGLGDTEVAVTFSNNQPPSAATSGVAEAEDQ